MIRAAVAEELGVTLEKRRLELPGGSRAEVDGVSHDESVLVEIFAHHGELKGGQKGKVARDALKLLTLGKPRKAKLYIAFADEEAAALVTTGKTWIAEALRFWDIGVLVVELEEAERVRVRKAQFRQRR